MPLRILDSKSVVSSFQLMVLELKHGSPRVFGDRGRAAETRFVPSGPAHLPPRVAVEAGTELRVGSNTSCVMFR